MTGDLCQVPLGALIVSAQLTAEVAHNFTQSLLKLPPSWLCRCGKRSLLSTLTHPACRNSSQSFPNCLTAYPAI
jgi:hypothetical protein